MQEPNDRSNPTDRPVKAVRLAVAEADRYPATNRACPLVPSLTVLPELNRLAAGFQHPEFAAARLTIANERIEGLVMPCGMMEHFGLVQQGWIRPCSVDDLDSHIEWLKKHGLPNSVALEIFETEAEGDHDA